VIHPYDIMKQHLEKSCIPQAFAPLVYRYFAAVYTRTANIIGLPKILHKSRIVAAAYLAP